MMKILRYIWSAVINMPCTWLSKWSLCYSCLLFSMQSFASAPPRRWILIWSLWKVRCLIKIGLTYWNTTLSQLMWLNRDSFPEVSSSYGEEPPPPPPPFSETGHFPVPVNMLSLNVLIWIHKGFCRLWQCSVSYLLILSTVMPVTSPPSAVSKIVHFSAHS